MGILAGTERDLGASSRPSKIALRRLAVVSAVISALALLALFHAPSRAIETDQYYAWGRDLDDSTDVLNARINSAIEEGLVRVNDEARWDRRPCEEVVRRIVFGLRYLIFWKPELWAMNSALVDRVPSTPEEERRYRKSYLYAHTSPLDTVRRMPPSPTIQAAGVRFGTDKLTHFFSEGYLQHGWRRDFLAKGLPPDEAERRAIRRGILMERTLLGMTSSGVFSPADLEANHAGMRFYDGLCGGDDPALLKTDSGWRLRRPVDLRQWVTPEWDESWQPNAYSERRFRKLLPAILAYCPLLEDAEVSARRAAYLARDRESPTERVLADLVREGKIPDPATFSIERLCEDRGWQPSGSSPVSIGGAPRVRNLSPPSRFW